jgi:hypothetical protein
LKAKLNRFYALSEISEIILKSLCYNLFTLYLFIVFCASDA